MSQGLARRLLPKNSPPDAPRKGRVLWGWSGDREASPPYWEALRTFVEDKAAHERRAFFGADARQISIILPELREIFRFEERPSIPDDESARFRLADAVRAFFHRTARQRCMLPLEELHWADQGSSFLLEFISQGIGEHPLLVLMTYRDGEVAAPLAKTLGELARLGVTRLEWNGLTLDGTARLMASVAGRRPATRVVRQVHARTDGNPFFVTEIARLNSRDSRAIPDNVRTAISTPE